MAKKDQTKELDASCSLQAQEREHQNVQALAEMLDSHLNFTGLAYITEKDIAMYLMQEFLVIPRVASENDLMIAFTRDTGGAVDESVRHFINWLRKNY